MHPQVRQPGPGTCPICGMALEPEEPSAEAGPNPELVDFTRRFWIGLVLTLPVLAMEMGGHVLGLMDLRGVAEPFPFVLRREVTAGLRTSRPAGRTPRPG